MPFDFILRLFFEEETSILQREMASGGPAAETAAIAAADGGRPGGPATAEGLEARRDADGLRAQRDANGQKNFPPQSKRTTGNLPPAAAGGDSRWTVNRLFATFAGNINCSLMLFFPQLLQTIGPPEPSSCSGRWRFTVEFPSQHQSN